MIAVVIAAPSQSSSLLVFAAVAVAVMGLGPLGSWIATKPAPKRWVYATALGLVLWFGLIAGNRTLHVRTQPAMSCEQGGWFLSWLFYGDFDCGGGGG